MNMEDEEHIRKIIREEINNNCGDILYIQSLNLAETVLLLEILLQFLEDEIFTEEQNIKFKENFNNIIKIINEVGQKENIEKTSNKKSILDIFKNKKNSKGNELND